MHEELLVERLVKDVPGASDLEEKRKRAVDERKKKACNRVTCFVLTDRFSSNEMNLRGMLF